MDELVKQLDFRIGTDLEAKDGILDRLDYRALRRLGVQLRNIPKPRMSDRKEDWDLPQAYLAGWIKSYGATLEAIRVAQESGIMRLIQENGADIRQLVSERTIPAVDEWIIGKEELERLIKEARQAPVATLKFIREPPTEEKLAKVLVVDLYDPGPFSSRPKVDDSVGRKRLQIGALIGKAASGGALVVGNMALGVLALSVVPSVSLTNVAGAVSLITSAYTGFTAAFDAIGKIAEAV